MNTGRNSHPRYGWTAVEVVFVLLVVLIGVSVLLPVLQAARWKSQQVATEERLISIGVAIDAYRRDHGDWPGYFERDRWRRGAFAARFNGNENLMLSLMGGMVESEAATRPFRLPGVPSDRVIDLAWYDAEGLSDRLIRYGAYYLPKRGELGVIKSTDPRYLNTMPELLDPVTQLPVHYYRPDRDGVVPVSYSDRRPHVFSRLPYRMLISPPALVTPTGQHWPQRESLLFHVPKGATSEPISNANMAMAVIDPARSDLTAGASPNGANDADDRVRSSGALLWSPGRDGVFMSRRQNPGRGAVIRRAEDVELFDDVLHWTGSR